MKLKCVICGNPVNKEDLLVKIEDSKTKEFIRTVPVHIGCCDDKLKKMECLKGNITNSAQNIFFFNDDEEIEKYMKNKEYLTDEEIYNRIFDDNNHIKP